MISSVFVSESYVALLLLSAFLSVALAAWALATGEPGAVWIAVALLAAAEWCAGYALEISARGFEAKVVWCKLEYLGILSGPWPGSCSPSISPTARAASAPPAWPSCSG